jgi:hypothetical protein
VTEFFGYNNNVAMGNRNCIYYVTLYNTKGNQEEEQCPFLRHCTVIAKYLRKLRNEEQVISGLLSSGPGNIKTFDFFEPNFNVGLGHALSGIVAHLSSTILSALHLVIDKSRTKFSHELKEKEEKPNYPEQYGTPHLKLSDNTDSDKE